MGPGAELPAQEGAKLKYILNFRTLFVALTVGAAVYAVRSGRPVGRFIGVPYDFRVPTADRIRDRLWNENDDRIFTPMVFGAGWSINFFRLVEKFREDNAAADGTDLPPPTSSSGTQPLP